MRILVVEDDLKSAEALSKGLVENSYEVEIVTTGDAALSVCKKSKFDLILLDIMLPGFDGLDVLKHLRAAGNMALTIIVTAKDELEDRIKGLDSGADAYLIKPYAFGELLAVIRSLSRRTTSNRTQEMLNVGDLTIDFIHHVATRGGKKLDLTPKEFQLLGMLARNKGESLSRGQISTEVWDMQYDSGTNVVDVHIRRLRSKVDDPFTKKLIHTVRGIGYVLRAVESKRDASGTK